VEEGRKRGNRGAKVDAIKFFSRGGPYKRNEWKKLGSVDRLKKRVMVWKESEEIKENNHKERKKSGIDEKKKSE